MHNLLRDPVIRVVDARGQLRRLTLPGLLAHAMVDDIAELPALQPHQRHALHAFLCQVGAIACLRARVAQPPRDEEAWAGLLGGLTRDHPDDAPWCLVAPPERPAFLQAPVPEGAPPLNRDLPTPDALDMLVTAKNHDVKAHRLARAEPDEWLLALLTLQTMEGFMGAGNYGISRMNGGFSNRPAVGVAPEGGMGAHVRRDIGRLIALREQVLSQYSHFDPDGLALVWLVPWDGTSSLDPSVLDPYYVEICRRVRLVAEGGTLRAIGAGTKVARIATAKKDGPSDGEREGGGVTGDPWTPIEIGKKGSKALTVDARLFSYDRVSAYLDKRRFEPAPLQRIAPDEPGERFTLVCRALVRGQGRTEGFAERRIPIPRSAGKMFRRGEDQRIAEIAKERVAYVGEVAKALRLALMRLVQDDVVATRDLDHRDPAAKRRLEAPLRRLDQRVDATFFARLFEEVDVAADETLDAEARAMRVHEVRRAWLADLREEARAILREAESGAPRAVARSYRAGARARNAFDARFLQAFGDFFPKAETDTEDADHDAAA